MCSPAESPAWLRSWIARLLISSDLSRKAQGQRISCVTSTVKPHGIGEDEVECGHARQAAITVGPQLTIATVGTASRYTKMSFERSKYGHITSRGRCRTRLSQLFPRDMGGEPAARRHFGLSSASRRDHQTLKSRRYRARSVSGGPQATCQRDALATTMWPTLWSRA